jgi:hypothetical protein
MQRIAKARPWADAGLHANPPTARRARAKRRAATRFLGCAKRYPTERRLGIVINFGQKRILDGWERVANRMPN